MRAVALRGRRMRRQGTRCEGYCEAMLSAPLTARPPALGDGHTHEAHATRMRGCGHEKSGRGGEGVRILFSWSRRRKRRSVAAARRFVAARGDRGALCMRAHVEYHKGFLQRRHRVPSDTLVFDLQFRLRCRTATPARVFASPSSTTGRAAIIRSRGWSGWSWRGREMRVHLRWTLSESATKPLASNAGNI